MDPIANSRLHFLGIILSNKVFQICGILIIITNLIILNILFFNSHNKQTAIVNSYAGTMDNSRVPALTAAVSPQVTA